VIVAIADDYTGAAEVAGVGHRYGLRAEVQTRFRPAPGAELVVVDTASRSLSPAEAAQATGEAGRLVAQARPELVFKKVDSVLRGPVLAELEALMAALGCPRALLVAGHPQAGRTIAGGTCYVAGVPLAETDFTNDPEYPARSSRVLDLLGPGSQPVVLAPVGTRLAGAGTLVAEVTRERDLASWAQALGADALPAGGAAFFAALLASRGHRPRPSAPPATIAGKALLVSGSACDYSRTELARLKQAGLPVAEMPVGLFSEESGELLRAWVEQVTAGLQQAGVAVLAVGGELRRGDGLAPRLCRLTAAAVCRVLQEVPVTHLLIAGGATASAIMRSQGWHRASVACEYSQGVVGLRPQAGTPHLTTKPGSYGWPGELVSCLSGPAKGDFAGDAE